VTSTKPALLEVEHLTIRSEQTAAVLVQDTALQVARGECLGLVGESGSGKTLTLRSLIGLLPPGVAQVSGALRLAHDVSALPQPYDPQEVRGRGIGMVFQDPAKTLNPSLRIRQTIAEPLRQHAGLSRSQVTDRVLELLDDVGIADAARVADAYPHQLSGGQRQRALIAAALACEPDLLLCDEPTTALDVTTQAQIIELLRRLSVERGLAMIFVSHDLAVISQVADRVAVMYAGQIVEMGDTEAVLRSPCHPYTLGLVQSVPRLNGPRKRLSAIPGRPPAAGEPRSGCSFLPRCSFATEACRNGVIALARPATERRVRCLHWDLVATEQEETARGIA
jgi:oligopeptide/dipeptide ABC transporter ATP-binding protein